MRPDPDQLDADELAARRFDRDLEREPGLVRSRCAPRDIREVVAQRSRARAFQVGIDPELAPAPCPSCNEPVFAHADSDRERVDCSGCDARLVTRLGIDGALDLVLLERDGAP